MSTAMPAQAPKPTAGYAPVNGLDIEAEYKKLSPTPNEFPDFVKRVVAIQLKPYDFGASELKATKAPFLFIHGDADGVRLDHIAEMFRLKGDEIHGDLRPRSESRLAVLPNTTHVTLMEKGSAIVPMVTISSTRNRRDNRGRSVARDIVRGPKELAHDRVTSSGRNMCRRRTRWRDCSPGTRLWHKRWPVANVFRG
jgi:hypothetical protein